MKWMIAIGLAAAVIGALYRWIIAPSESDKWRAIDVIVVIVGIVGAVFFVVGLILLGVQQIFGFFR
jgi:multisubunit Na+/H+ antiporter MnhF subunit